MTRHISAFSTLCAVALALACGPKNSPEPAAPAAPATKAADAPAGDGAIQLVDAWYVDNDDDGVPDFVELEQNYDPKIDECIVQACGQDAGEGKLVEHINTLIILDVSGSMAGKVDGKHGNKLDLARKAVARYVQSMPDVELMKVGLMVFGHQGDATPAGKAKSCAAIDTLRGLVTDGFEDQARRDARGQRQASPQGAGPRLIPCADPVARG